MLSDAELLAIALDGAEDAFAALYRRRQAGVYRFALQMTGSTAAADDVTQETFLALLTHGNRYDAGRGAVASFLYGIARNHVMKWLERHPPALLEEDLPGEDDPLEDLTRRETIEGVRRAVLGLPPVYREVVVLCDLQDFSYEQAAQTLRCPIGTVRSRLCRGRSMLARRLRAGEETVRCVE